MAEPYGGYPPPDQPDIPYGMEEMNMSNFIFGNIETDGSLAPGAFDQELRSQLQSVGSILPQDNVLLAEQDDSAYQPHPAVQSGRPLPIINEVEEDDEFADDEGEENEVYDSENDDAEEFAMQGGLDSNPLALMLPAEYKDVNVRKFFPDFKPGKVLRFTRLFGTNRPSSQPLIWRGAKNRKRPPIQPTEAETAAAEAAKIKSDPETTDAEESQSDSEQAGFGQSKPHLRLQFAPTPPPEECETDDEIHLMKPEELGSRRARKLTKEGDDGPKIAPWRHGPAAYWYDKFGVSETGEGFNYGFKLKDPTAVTDQPSTSSKVPEIPPEAFLMFNQARWEEDIILNGDDVRDAVLSKYSGGKQPICGWIPTQFTRTFDSFMELSKNGKLEELLKTVGANPTAPPPKAPVSPTFRKPNQDDSNCCVFPPDNLELMYGDWEKDIILDDQAMERIPQPLLPTVDASEDIFIYGMPDDKPLRHGDVDKDDTGHAKPEHHPKKVFKDQHFSKKSQMILGNVTTRQKEDDEEVATSSTATEKDPFNLSNDEYYLPKSATSTVGFMGSLIQHAIPTQNIAQPFFPTHLNAFRLRHFYRMPLKKFSRGPLSKSVFHGVGSLEQFVDTRRQLREKERMASGGGEMFFMRTPEDISAKDGDLILCEFSEEHPSLMQQPGMASKIKNYYKRKPGKDSGEPPFEFGETAYTHTSPFLGSLLPGEYLQSLENHLYRAPIYRHDLPHTDFLVIRTRHRMWVRAVQNIFAVGQECPLYEVPSPNSKRASTFQRDFLLVFIYRLFHKSTEEPKKIRMEDIRRAFPQYAESSIRKRLKMCADYKRLGAGPESNFWILKPEFRLPSLDELRALVSPEMCCAYYSMVAAEQRLKDAGYGEKYFFAKENDDDDDEQVKMEDEIKCAPWNTTRAYLAAMKGKCLLDLTGVADPTGSGEGFSYVRVSAKPQKEEAPAPQLKRTVTGTDADLRKLSLKNAKQLLKDFGVKEEEIKSLTRWEIIDVIRTLSTQQAKIGGTGITKFARGSMRYSLNEIQNRYKQECQRIFELQNRVLMNTEVLSTDEESSFEEDSDIEEMGKNIENMLSTTSKKQKDIQRNEDEEEERKELQRMLRGEFNTDEKSGKDKGKRGGSDDEGAGVSEVPRILIIYRTFEDADGREHVNKEEIRKPQLIEAYLKVRNTKDDSFIRSFAQEDEQYKEEVRREKRRLQDQLRRLKRNEDKMKKGVATGRLGRKSNSPAKPTVAQKLSLLKTKCSACGGQGHMRTNKNCPLYSQTQLPSSKPIAPTDEHLAEEFDLPPAENLVSVEGTKLKLSKALMDHAEKIKKKSLILKFPKQALKRSLMHPSLLPPALKNPGEHTPGRVGRPPKDPLKRMETEREKLERLARKAERQMLKEQKLQFKVVPKRKPVEDTDYLVKPKPQMNEVGISRSRADPRISFGIILESILTDIKKFPQSEHFLMPVNKKQAEDYAQIIKRPMDLQKIRVNLSKSKYSSREEFLRDFKLIVDNSALYNGLEHPITQAARYVFEFVVRRINEKENKLMKLEKAINPLLDDNDLVGFSFVLSKITEQLKSIPKSFPFHNPVDKKKVKDYYVRIQHPMDLGTIERRLKLNLYQSAAQYLRDVQLIATNSETYNGLGSMYTAKAREIFETAKRLVGENSKNLQELEKNIRMARETAMEALETDSELTATSYHGGDPMEYQYQTADDDIFAAAQRGLMTGSSGYADTSGPSTSSFSYNFDQIAAAAISGGEEFYEQPQPAGSSGVLTQDLVISDNEDESVEGGTPGETSPKTTVVPTDSPENSNLGYELGGDFDPVSQSRIGLVGQLHNDLAMSDSDAEGSEDSESREPKRKISRLQPGDDDDNLFHM